MTRLIANDTLVRNGQPVNVSATHDGKDATLTFTGAITGEVTVPINERNQKVMVGDVELSLRPMYRNRRFVVGFGCWGIDRGNTLGFDPAADEEGDVLATSGYAHEPEITARSPIAGDE